MAAKHYVALLRGVNVGGKNKVPMADLRACVEGLGCTKVQTYIASGNVLFESKKSAAALTRELSDALRSTFALDGLVNVLLLSREQMHQVLAQAPKGFGAQPAKYHSNAIFLMGVPAAEAFKAFNPRDGVDRVWQGDLAIYSERLSAQRTKSRLSKVMSDPVYKRMTIRSWQTTEKLAALLESLAS